MNNKPSARGNVITTDWAAQAVLQKIARTALTSNNLKFFMKALQNGAQVGLTVMQEDDSKFKLGKLDTYTIGHLAVHTAMFHGSTAILQAMKDENIDLKPYMKVAELPCKRFDNVYGDKIMDFFITNWPEGQGRWQDIFSLHQVAMHGDKKQAAMLVKRKLPINEKDENGRTPLMYARSGEMAKKLISLGANREEVDGNGKTALWHAVQHLVRSAKINGQKQLVVYLKDIAPAEEIAGQKWLLEDPHALSLARQLIKRVNDGLIVDMTPAENHPKLKALFSQAHQVMTQNKKHRLSKFMSRKKDVVMADRIETTRRSLKM